MSLHAFGESDDVALGTILVEQKVPNLDLVLDENLVLVEIAQGLELDFELNTFMGDEDFGQPLEDFVA